MFSIWRRGCKQQGIDPLKWWRASCSCQAESRRRIL